MTANLHRSRLLYSVLLLTSVLTPLAASALPTGGTVASGSATIANSGSTTTVTQSTPSAVINWTGFNTNGLEHVNFAQPSSSAVTLNKISGPATTFNGYISANGNVWLINQNGFVFGQYSGINTAGFLATTSNISNSDFMAGKYNFTPGSNHSATITNNGSISVAQAGLAALVAPNVINNGSISARLGKINLGSGDKFTIDLAGDGLINLVATPAMASQILQANGSLYAPGGTVAITAAQASSVVDSVINLDGLYDAANFTASNKNGDVEFGGKFQNSTNSNFVLKAKDNITVDNNAVIGNGHKVNVTLDSDSDANNAGSIFLNGSTSIKSSGGNITMGGGTHPLTGYAVGESQPGLDSDGNGITIESKSIDAGGGNIVINGKGIVNDGYHQGIGVSLYSEDGISSMSTAGNGSITLNGAGVNNSGVEINGYIANSYQQYNLSAESGAINITGTTKNTDPSQSMPSPSGVILAGSNLSTTSGAININGTADVNTNTPYGGSATGVNINVYSSITTGSGNVNLTGTSDLNCVLGGCNLNSQGVLLATAPITSSTGNISINGSSSLNITGLNEGVAIEGSNISTAGNITIKGLDDVNSATPSIGVVVEGSTISSTGKGKNAGKISITGTGSQIGVWLDSYDEYSPTTISTVDGNVAITGTAAGNGSGILNEGGNQYISTGKGKFTFVSNP